MEGIGIAMAAADLAALGHSIKGLVNFPNP
jgi:hypothetical protein